MKRRDLFISTLVEVSGKAEAVVVEMFETFCAANPDLVEKFDQDLPDAEAKQLVADFRAEAPGILAWLEHGALQLEAKTPQRVQ